MTSRYATPACLPTHAVRLRRTAAALTASLLLVALAGCGDPDDGDGGGGGGYVVGSQVASA